MGGLDEIPVRVANPSWAAGNAVPILNEIRHALITLLESGQETIIDLQSLPLGPADETQLMEALGSGEVEARLDTLGKSIIRETQVSGVWMVEHYNVDEQPLSKFIEITHIPSILKAQPEDIQAGLAQLTERLTATRLK
jgi:hydrogenase-1 operon protein HyaF